MVICQYFLNNTCRYGTKCHNEHVNVKLTLKTDAESALKGKQWPLSSYGPFRDKPCIPNFIEDQSFEEARNLCYEAKATGNIQMMMNQFTQDVLDAKNKMNMLTNPTDDVVALVTNLYNSTSANTTNPNANSNASPFGMGSNSMNTASNVFGGGTNVAPTNTNLLGSPSASSNSNPFVRNAASFGAPSQNQNTNLFGASNSQATNSMNLFGTASNQPVGAGGNLFGGSAFSNSNTNNTLFGAASQTPSVFGGTTNPTATPFGQPTSNASPFGMSTSTTNQTSNLFGGQAQQSNPIFGGGATFGSQVKTGLFGQTNVSMAQTTNSGNIFGQNAQPQGFGPQPTQTNNIFGGQSQSQSIFGAQQTVQAQDNPFATVARSATTNIFGNAQLQQQPQIQQQPQAQQQPPPFGSSIGAFGATQNAPNAFGNNQNMGQSIFGANQMTNSNQMTAVQAPAPAPAMTLQQQQQSIFGTSSFSAQPTMAAQAPFGGNMLQNAQQPQTQPFFGVQPQQQNVFGAQQPQQISKTLYTPMDSLTPEEVEAFKSDAFDISKIPTKPPPMELCT